ncbi:lipocalin-like domain-containing protein [Geomesophilobacter sediminis]|uniref:Carotenoid 1,2-hydratase n=1 Tax=Geomesophilobacter sediminis TaxID=2798584 RepID=A0A8J7JKK3_9BACT|nr:lipocalin-like domain-containing protein [Geomesophilobacter sediminis]MBJ6723965.1 carotenoid 1,2-hydratase [Geomesophilobacter sediminis]
MRRRSLGIGIAVVVLGAGLLLIRQGGDRKSGHVERPAGAVTGVLGGAADPRFTRAYVPRPFTFPRDHGPHPDFRTEWWYFTGNLATAEGRKFGYQLTFFRLALAPGAPNRRSRWGANQVYMAHFALTDVAGKRFRFEERFSRAALGLAGAESSPVRVWLEDWTARQIPERPERFRLAASEADYGIDLDLARLTREVLNGERGLSRKGPTSGNASYYYSLPRLATTGTVRIGAARFTVAGSSWLDREWSTSALEPDQVGWDWFALQLDDGRELMWYRLRRRDGSIDPFSSGTLVEADGRCRQLTPAQVVLVPEGSWTSPKTGARYPARWRLQLPAQRIDLAVVPRIADQELTGNFPYWEGAVALLGRDGAPKGVGYLEMTGYAGAGTAGGK